MQGPVLLHLVWVLGVLPSDDGRLGWAGLGWAE